MRKHTLNLWTLGGLSLPELLRRTARESWKDDVFGQGGRMAFYQFLAIFPSLLVLFTISAHIPHLIGSLRNTFQDLSRQLLPGEVSQLFDTMLNDLSAHHRSGMQLLSVCVAALWAAHNGTWAMIYGLNKAYEVQERRSWQRLTVTIAGLTFALTIATCVAVLLIFLSAYLQAHLQKHLGGGIVTLRVLEWLVLTASLSVCFAMLYRFAPNLPDHRWRWSTPGTGCALILWIAATFIARAYFNHVNNYSRSYGPLNGVVMLMLWLYASNGAILIGGEMNSEIEKAAAEQQPIPKGAAHPQDRSHAEATS